MSSPLLFWLMAFALLAGTLGWLLTPLLRQRGDGDAPADDSATTAVFRDHQRQVEADYAGGTISAMERGAALAELVTRFGHELDAAVADTKTAASPRSRWISALVIVACLPAIAGALYLYLGQPAAINAATAAPDAAVANAQIVAMVDTLAKRLQDKPEDGEGWAMLGRSYRALGRFEPAAQAYAEAAKRLAPSAALLTDQAEVIGLVQGRSLIGQPTALLNRALVLDPDFPKALALSGAAAAERNDSATAIAMWTRLRARLPAGSPEAAQVDGVIAQLGGASAPSPAPVTAGPAAASKTPTATGNGDAAPANPGTSANNVTNPTATATVDGTVQLDPALAARVQPGDTVFIFARDPQGSRMPLAAIKLTVAELPKTFSLTDAMAMSAAATISKASSIVVEARVSKAGDVIAKPGDLTGKSAAIKAGARDVRVTIDQVVR